MKKNGRMFLYVTYIIAIVVMVIVAEYFTNRKEMDKVIASIEYQEQSNVDYRVFYKENNYFDSAYIEKGKTYISSLIDTIAIDFNYRVDYSEVINGESSYYIKAVIEAVDASNNNQVYWQKDYALTERELVSYENSKDYTIQKSVIVDYQKFNDLLKEFKSDLKLNMDAFLKVELVVENKGSSSQIDSIQYSSNVELNMPLATSAMNIEINSSLAEDKQVIEKKESHKESRFWNMIISGACWVMCLFISACFAITYHLDMESEGAYKRRLRKILTTYDMIIVNVQKLPSIKNKNVVSVTTFEELVDAQNEVRLPINFKEDESIREAKFILMSEEIAWVYTLKDGEEHES